jgi:hypothetical protein
MTSPRDTTFTAVVSEHDGLLVTKNVPAGVDGPFSSNPEAKTSEQVEQELDKMGFVVHGEWKVRWTFQGPVATARLRRVTHQNDMSKSFEWSAR